MAVKRVIVQESPFPPYQYSRSLKKMQPLLTGKFQDDPLNHKIVIRGTYNEFEMQVDGENLLNSNVLILFKQKLNKPDSEADIKLSFGDGIYLEPREGGITLKIVILPEHTLRLPKKNLLLKYNIQIAPTNGQNYSLSSGEILIVIDAIDQFPVTFNVLTATWENVQNWLAQFSQVVRLTGELNKSQMLLGTLKQVGKFSPTWDSNFNFSGNLDTVTPENKTANWSSNANWQAQLKSVTVKSGIWQNVQFWSGQVQLDLGLALTGGWSNVHSYAGSLKQSIKRSRNWSNQNSFSGQLVQVTGDPVTVAFASPGSWVRGIETVPKFSKSWSVSGGWIGSIVQRASYEMLRIMPLGDSLTSGNVNAQRPEPTGYRLPLWTNLKESRRVDFVGTLKNGSGLLDRDHAGYDGYTTVQLDGIINTLLSVHDPDLVVLMIGTNDSNNSANTATVYRQNLVNLINKIKAYDSQIIIVLQTLYPIKNNTTRNNRVTSYNTEIRNLLSTDNSLFLADVAGLVDTNQYLDDIHPTDNAYTPGALEIANVILSIPGGGFGRVRKRTNDQGRSGNWVNNANWISGKLGQAFDGSWNNAASWIDGELIQEVQPTALTGGWSNLQTWNGALNQVGEFTGTWDNVQTWSGALNSGVVIDPVVQTWMDNVTANGGAYDQVTVNALNTLVEGLKTDDLWDLIYQINPICGEDWKAAQVKLKHPVSTSTIETLVNHSASTYSKTGGFQGVQSSSAGTTRYIRTDFSPALQGCTSENFGMHYDTSQGKGTGTSSIWIMGLTESATDGSDASNTVLFEAGGTQLVSSINQPGTASSQAIYTTAVNSGLMSVQMSNATNFRTHFYVNGVAVVAAATAQGTNRAFRAGEIYVQTRNRMHQSTVQLSTNRNCRGYMLSQRFTDTQLSNFVNRWNTFKTAIGR